VDTSGAQSIGTTFLSDLDRFLAQNWQQLRCRDIYDIYFKFWNDLKDFRGTSTNFTGLSELLVFRFIIHQIGGSFKKIPINKDTAEFANGNLRIRQGLSVPGMRCRPDITIWKSEELIGVIQIKVFLVNGWKTFQGEMTTFNSLKKLYSDELGTLLLIYDDYTVPKELKIGNSYPFVFLKGNDALLHATLDYYIPSLKRISKANLL